MSERFPGVTDRAEAIRICPCREWHDPTLHAICPGCPWEATRDPVPALANDEMATLDLMSFVGWHPESVRNLVRRLLATVRQKDDALNDVTWRYENLLEAEYGGTQSYKEGKR